MRRPHAASHPRPKNLVIAFLVASLMLFTAPAPAIAASGTMSCGGGGTPRTTGHGGGLQYHWVQGSPGTWNQAPGTLTLYWSWRTGNRSWAVNAPSGGFGTCIT